MSELPITKRLHISGLTPVITAEDISKRLSTFGTVKTVDGIGLLDGLGEPRKFGYITIETTTVKLAKCMNLLSGAIWKDAKLRLGEAKPDYPVRIAVENTASEEQEHPKKRRKVYGEYANDMTLVTPENAASRGRWKVTPLGRIIYPLKMRPPRPLPPQLEDKVKKLAQKKQNPAAGEVTKKKKRIKEPDSRARRRVIDVTKWGSTHLKGIFLESQGMSRGMKITGDIMDQDISDVEISDEDDEMIVIPNMQREEEEEPLDSPPITASEADKEVPTRPVSSSVSFAKVLSPHFIAPDDNTDIALEKSKSLNFLASLFGDRNDSEWMGQESAGSDVDEELLLRGDTKFVDGYEDDFEVVPLSDAPSMAKQPVAEIDPVTAPQTGPPPAKAGPQLDTTLKDLFAPQNKDAGFSLVGHLDLEFEQEDEIPFAIETANVQQIEPSYSQSPIPIGITTNNATQTQSNTYINPKQALFFPLPPSHANKARQRDIFDVMKDNKWSWRDPTVGFYRIGTEEDIRKEWEEARGELTQGWKRRAREAGKMNRRRRGGADVDGE